MKGFYSSDAVVLSSKTYGEADKIVWLYTKKYGKFIAIAKGVRRIKSKKRAGIETFNLIKFSAVETHRLPIITEVEIINGMENIRAKLPQISVAYFLAEVVTKLTDELEENQELYSLFVDYLKQLGASGNLKEFRLNYVQDVVRILGYWPKGTNVPDPDNYLEEITERRMSSVRVGKKLQM